MEYEYVKVFAKQLPPIKTYQQSFPGPALRALLRQCGCLKEDAKVGSTKSFLSDPGKSGV